MYMKERSSEQNGTSHFLAAPWVAIQTSFRVNREKLNNSEDDENQG